MRRDDCQREPERNERTAPNGDDCGAGEVHYGDALQHACPSPLPPLKFGAQAPVERDADRKEQRAAPDNRPEEHQYALQSPMRTLYDVLCLKNTKPPYCISSRRIRY